MKRTLLFFFLSILFFAPARAQQGSRLKRIYFNLYTDSLKPVLNYYVNVEGEFANGRFLPLDTNDVTLTCDHGTLAGMEWVIPKTPVDYPCITFRVISKTNPALRDSVTIFIQRRKDPEDEAIMRSR